MRYYFNNLINFMLLKMSVFSEKWTFMLFMLLRLFYIVHIGTF